MSRELPSKIFLLLLYLSLSPSQLFAFQESTTVTVHASKMTFSKKVDNVGDHVVFWGIATGENTRVSYSLQALPFKNFSLEVEAGADTAAGRWPNVGIAFNDPNSIETDFQVQSLTTTTFMQLGQFTPGENDSIIYFVFTNDYWDPDKGHDVNLKLRNIRFTGSTIVPPTMPDSTLKIMGDSVRVSWLPNTEPDLAGYKIHYGNASRSYTSIVDVEQETSHVLKLPINRTYFLAVTAYDTAGNSSSYSDEMVFYMASTTPSDTVVVEGDSVTVRWDANRESDLAGYRIFYGSASRSYSDSITVGLTTLYVLNLPPNKTYFLALKAFDQSGNLSNFSSEVVFSTAITPDRTGINCDINEDGLVDLNDWLAFNAGFDSNKGEQRFRENADFNKDEKIDHADQEIANTKCLNPWSIVKDPILEAIKIGDNFLIHVSVKKAKNVFGFVTSLDFPVDALEINQNNGQPDVVMGDFLGDKATILANLSLNTTNNVGTLIIGYSLKGAMSEKNGEGLMFSIRARAVKETEYQLVWSANSAVQDSNQVNQPSNFEDFLLKVVKNIPDINIVSITIEKEN